MPEPLRNEVTTKELADLCGVTVRAVQKWVEAGCPCAGKNKYLLSEAVQWLVARDRGPGKLSESRFDLYRVQKEKIELDIEATKRTLIPADEVHHIIAEMVHELVSTFDALPPRVGTLVAAIDTPAEVEALIEREVHHIREIGSERLRAIGAPSQPGRVRRRASPKRVNGKVGRRTSRVASGQP